MRNFHTMPEIDKNLTKIILDEHKRLPFLERIKENFSKDLWKLRYECYIKNASISNIESYYC